MIQLTSSQYLIIAMFLLGYLAIAFEHVIKINKAASAIITAVAIWSFVYMTQPIHLLEKNFFIEHIGEISQLLFFLLGAMAIVEIVDAHGGFSIITSLIRTQSKRKMLWLTCIICFFLSSVLDNLTTTIVMISLLKKLVPEREDRLVFGAMVVISANSGGAWTPIGDLTTTMLWIEGLVTTPAIIKGLIIPSLISVIVSLVYQSLSMKGTFRSNDANSQAVVPTLGSKRIFVIGISSLIFVPVFKEITGLHPFLGVLLGLGVLWIITDILHHKDEHRAHLRMPYILGKVDISGVLFFLGILLSVAALDSVGILSILSKGLNQAIPNTNLVAILIGFISSVVDNVPLVSACMSMYPVEQFPIDSHFWMLIAYCAGVGGSILVIGSAAGIAYMGLEKVDFLWYLKKITPTAIIGYLSGAAAYIAWATFFT